MKVYIYMRNHTKKSSKLLTSTRKIRNRQVHINNSIIVCSPNRTTIELANKNPKESLFKTRVDFKSALKQHNYLIEILNEQGFNVIDIADSVYLPDNISYKNVSNMLFTRDPFIKTPKGIILGNMKERIRKYEPVIMERILNMLGQSIVYKCKGNEFLEGGDVLINGNTTFIGTGIRTSMTAAKQLLKLNLYGTDRVVIIYPNHPDTSMYRIHLDCVFSPFGNKQCVLWSRLAQSNQLHSLFAVEYTISDNGRYKQTSNPTLFVEYLKNSGYNIIPISTKSQHNYGTNILELDNGIVLVQDKETHKKIKGSIIVPFNEIHKMYGGIHCSTNFITRKFVSTQEDTSREYRD